MIKRQHINQVNSQIMPVVKEAENEDREQEENDQQRTRREEMPGRSNAADPKLNIYPRSTNNVGLEPDRYQNVWQNAG